MFLIVAHLRTAVGVRESGNGIDIIFKIDLGLPLDRGSDVVNASHCGNNPNFIPYANGSVLSPVTLEIMGFGGRKGSAG